VNSAPTMCWQAAILDQETSPPSTAVKNIFQFWKLRRRSSTRIGCLSVRCLSTGNGCSSVRCLSTRNGCSSIRCSSTRSGCSISKLLAALQLQDLSSSLMSMICFEFSLRLENKANTKTHKNIREQYKLRCNTCELRGLNV
jgi:hypothetical protein